MSEEITAGSEKGFLAGILWARAVGIHHNADHSHPFVGINQERFESVIAPELERLTQEVQDLKEVIEDTQRLTRDLDVAMHGEEGAAKQASLCDLIVPAERMRAEVQALRAEKEALEKDISFWKKLALGLKDELVSRDEKP